MSKCIGSITHDVFGSVGTLLSHSPGKSFGELFEEKKAQLESLQVGLTRAVLLKTRPKQERTSVKTPFVSRRD